MNKYLRYIGIAENPHYNSKKLKNIKVKIKIKDVEGYFKITDIMLQVGRKLTGWVPNTQEFLKRKRDINGNIEPPKFYNALLRKNNAIIIPNNGNVTTGINIELEAVKNTNGPIILANQYETRKFIYNELLQAGDRIALDPNTHKVYKNGQLVSNLNYNGVPLTCPAGMAIYKVQLHDKDSITGLFTIKEWERGVIY